MKIPNLNRIAATNLTKAYRLALGQEQPDMIRFVLDAHNMFQSPLGIAFGCVLRPMQFGELCVFFSLEWVFMLALSLGAQFLG